MGHRYKLVQKLPPKLMVYPCWVYLVPHLEPNPLDPFRLPTICVTFEVHHDSPHLIRNPGHFLRIGLVTALVADLAGLLGCVAGSPQHSMVDFGADFAS